jgi:LuxR family transcriptional regulator of csgAB operon
MSANSPENEKDSAPLADTLIYVIGPHRLQNELMASFIEREVGTRCLTEECPPPIPPMDDEGQAPPKLVLWDCLGKDCDTLLDELESDASEMLSRDLLALFNVGSGAGIEEKAVLLGVRGFFYEKDTQEQFVKGVRAVLDGALWLPKGIMTKNQPDSNQWDISSRKDSTVLTRREIEILSLVAVGAKNDQIADQLYISPNTVKTHIYNIYKKINVPNRLQAALWAVKHLQK